MSENVIPFPIAGRHVEGDAPPSAQTGTTYKTELRRHCQTREEASRYLSSRGFLLLPNGWANGRWAATVEIENGAFIVSAHLEPAKAA